MAHGVSEEALAPAFGDRFVTEVVAAYDPTSGRITSKAVTRIADLVIREKEGFPVPTETAEKLLCEQIDLNPCAFFPQNENFQQTRVRLECLSEWSPELKLSPWTDRDLASAVKSLVPGCRSRSDVLEKPLLSLLKGMMTHAQRGALETEAPEALDLPSSRRARLRYEVGRPPVLSARVQHLFGLLDTPRVANGRIPCVIECLAPNDRPVQITQDLRSFWINTYAQVRKDLRGRYPKHAWPEKAPGFE
jgi:ATP-dependent helicase HrpB